MDVCGSDTTADLDVHIATPVKILHTFLLGIVKYLWSALIEHLEVKATQVPDRPTHPLDTGGVALLEMRLVSLHKSGWNVPKINTAYMIQHHWQLVGKHFKTLAQCMPFIIEDIVALQMLEAWVLVGMTGVMLWSYDVVNKVEFELQMMMTMLIHAVARIDPIKMISKMKLHIAMHTMDDFKQLEPVVLYSTEWYKLFNFVF
ncbi:hypothetical protein DACRYDRAFT_58863 [Dacryopinax primogenitus]|uniref:Uncharacterized protein n=1 Tax=Dacryopinax primogenitus (strain DJM 731) TaxID=1858805 RepID=M5G1J4_DACPD|nr:uncharacterized protein DACRYDRAFT_58863 [Dacryopinax primogenitus]EJT97627.1 hypothetical protein DACRYDRAFT_58863 [Dacryopinax primogenitus]